MKRIALVVLLITMLPAAAAAQQQKVAIKVVDVAAGRAFVEPGEKDGLRVGQNVTIGDKERKVLEVTATGAVVDLAKDRIAVGASGSAVVTPKPESTATAQRAKPAPLARLRGLWLRPTLPASRQRPKFVRLRGGGGLSDGPHRVVLVGQTFAIAPDEQEGLDRERAFRGAVGARARSQVVKGADLWLDADAMLQGFGGVDPRFGGDSRPFTRVRELRVRYGEGLDPFAALGRLRAGAWGLGPIDGARVRSPEWRGLTASAFGGFLPDVESGEPSTEASRFGVGFAWRGEHAAARPGVALVAHASRFDGDLDERRVTATASLFPGKAALLAHAEVSAFDKDNPWGADPVELTSAGIDASVRKGAVRVGARMDMREPERSRWLAAHLPPGFLCTAVPSATLPEPCAEDAQARFLSAADASFSRGPVALSVSGVAIAVGQPGADDVFGHARIGTVGTKLRLDAGIDGALSDVVASYGARFGVGGALFRDRLDVGVAWRPGVVQYRAGGGSITTQRVSAEIIASPKPTLDIALAAEREIGLDAPGTAFLLTIAYRVR